MKPETYKKVKWLAFNGVFAGSLYFGYVEGIDGFVNVALFIAWLAVIVSPFTLAKPVLKEILNQGGPAMSDHVEGVFDIAVIVVFVYFGAWVTGAFYAVHAIIIQTGRKEMRDMVWAELKKEHPEYNYDK